MSETGHVPPLNRSDSAADDPAGDASPRDASTSTPTVRRARRLDCSEASDRDSPPSRPGPGKGTSHGRAGGRT
jgi:hypothetical protein